MYMSCNQAFSQFQIHGIHIIIGRVATTVTHVCAGEWIGGKGQSLSDVSLVNVFLVSWN